jgi:DNA-binding response OmpR family regulator
MAVLRAVVVGEIEIRPTEYLALAAGHPLRLTVRELELLTALAERRDRIVSREELYRGLGGGLPEDGPVGRRLYRAAATQARRGAPGTAYIHTHFGFGYRLSHPFHKRATAG